MSTAQGAKRPGSIAQRVWEIVLPTADELEYILWDVEFVKEGADYYLRITIGSKVQMDMLLNALKEILKGE